jgi:tripartite-type tricarboxylate transporter receptor subunit TctC
MKPISLAALPLILALAAAPAAADTYPDKPVSVIVPWAAGGAADLNVRSFVDAMSRVLGQPMPVLNRVGASGTIGTVELARARPDGYTIGNVSVGPLTTQPALRRQAYKVEDLDPICLHYSNPQFLVVARNAPYSTLAELQSWLKANPARAKYASPGIGSIPHVAGLALARSLDAPFEHIPFKGDAEMMVSTLGGDLVGWITQATFFQANRDKLKAIGVMSERRMDEFPDVPTLREQGHALVFDVWGGLAAPRGLPAAVRARLESACQQAAQSPEYQAVRTRLGMTAAYLPGAAFADFIRAESAKNAALLRQAGLAE